MDGRPTRVYRITHLDNLPHILEQGGIWCGNEMIRQGLHYVAIGDPDLTLKRSHKPVTVAAKGVLNDYVPFYFCPRPVMLYNVWRKSENTYGGGQESVIHLVAYIDQIQSTGASCFFTKQNAYMEYAEQIDDFDRINEVDWNIVRSKKWRNTPEDNRRRDRKMAEFLVHRFVPWFCFVGIGVYSEHHRQEVMRAFQSVSEPPPVKVMTGWYYP